jgi:hypothetical protein
MAGWWGREAELRVGRGGWGEGGGVQWPPLARTCTPPPAQHIAANRSTSQRLTQSSRDKGVATATHPLVVAQTDGAPWARPRTHHEQAAQDSVTRKPRSSTHSAWGRSTCERAPRACMHTQPGCTHRRAHWTGNCTRETRRGGGGHSQPTRMRKAKEERRRWNGDGPRCGLVAWQEK